MSRNAKTKRMERIVEDFNQKAPIGTTVRYFPISGQEFRHEYRDRKVKYPAEILSGHTPVVWLEGERGCVAVENCKIRNQQ